MNIRDMFDPELLADMLEQRMIRVRKDETVPVWVYDYTERAQYKRVWNEVTRGCRGLLVHAETGEVLARGMSKFYGHGEPDAPDLAGPVEVYDKADGSLGILYPIPGTAGEYAISTRGSLRSDQARRATQVWREKYAAAFVPNPRWTYLFEIIDPVSRVVVDYGDTSDLYLIGALETATGQNVPYDDVRPTWPGPAVEKFSFTTLAQALAAPPRPGAEGYVILDPATGERVKFKQADYVRLHRVITGLRRLDLWVLLAVEATKSMPAVTAAARLKLDPGEVARLRAGNGLDDLLAQVPDELYRDVIEEVETLTRAVALRKIGLQLNFHKLGLDVTDKKASAGRLVAACGDRFTTSVMLNLLNGVEIDSLVWLSLKPATHELVSTWAKTPSA